MTAFLSSQCLCNTFPVHQCTITQIKKSPSLFVFNKFSETSSRRMSHSIINSLTDRFVVKSVGTNSVENILGSNRIPSPEVMEIWKTADAVCFDVDSTVCIDEGIDELAKYCGAGEAVAAWTNRAMSGSVPFEDALSARLSLINPTFDDLSSFLEANPPKLSVGIQILVEKLLSKGKQVYLISGGFIQMIEPVAKILHIPKERIFANVLLFDQNGNFFDFDKNQLTSKSGGKTIAVKQIKKKNNFEKVVMIGDGATDLEAKVEGGADIFIGYGGSQVREKIKNQADWFVLNFDDLIDSL